MSNAYYNGQNGRASAPKPPSERSGGQASYKSESTHAWVADIGPVGRRRNTVGFAEVKQAAKQHMADDYGLPRDIWQTGVAPAMPGAAIPAVPMQPPMVGPGPGMGVMPIAPGIPGEMPLPMPEGGLRPAVPFPGQAHRRRRRGGGIGGSGASGREGY